MFADSTTARTYLRAGIATVAAMIMAAGTIWVDNPYIKIASAGIGVLALYLGVGAASVAEPFYGKEYRAEVPSPPAVRDDEA